MPHKQQIFEVINLKIIALLLLTFLSPIYGLFLLVSMAVTLDTMFAIYATVKMNGWSSVKSHNFFNVVIKTFFYLGTIIMAYLVSQHITDGSLFNIKYFSPKFMCAFWVFIEMKSIDETSVKLGNRSFIDTIKAVIKWIKSFKKDLSEITNKK